MESMTPEFPDNNEVISGEKSQPAEATASTGEQNQPGETIPAPQASEENDSVLNQAEEFPAAVEEEPLTVAEPEAVTPTDHPMQTDTARESNDNLASEIPGMPAEEHDLATLPVASEEHDNEPLENYGSLSKEELTEKITALVDEPDMNSVRNRIQGMKDAFQQIVQHEKETALAAFIENGGVREEFEMKADPLEEKFFDLYKKYQKRRFDFIQGQEKVRQENLKAKQDILNSMKNILQQEEDMSKAFNEFHSLQARWRSIGPVPPQAQNDLWMTYKLYTDRFYEFIKINRELQDLEMKKNLEMKLQLCERAEELILEPSLNKALQEGQALQHKWREIGAVPRDKRTEVWLRFKGVLDKIYEQKRHHLDGQKQQFDANLKAKNELIGKAAALLSVSYDKHNEWQDGLKHLLELQTEWRKTGPAGREQNDAVWQQFKSTCDQFFKNKDAFYKRRKQEYSANLQAKTELCVQAETLKESTDWKGTANELIRLQQEWKKIGPAGERNEKIWQRFKSACDAFFKNKTAHFADQNIHQDENLRLKNELITTVEQFVMPDNASEALDQLKDFQRKYTELGLVPLANKEDIQSRFRNAIQAHFDALKSKPGYKQQSYRSNDRPERQGRPDRNDRNERSFSRTPVVSSPADEEQRSLTNKMSKLTSEVQVWENNLGFFANSKNAASLRQEYEQKISEAREEITKLKSRLAEMRNAK